MFVILLECKYFFLTIMERHLKKRRKKLLFNSWLLNFKVSQMHLPSFILLFIIFVILLLLECKYFFLTIIERHLKKRRKKLLFNSWLLNFKVSQMHLPSFILLFIIFVILLLLECKYFFLTIIERHLKKRRKKLLFNSWLINFKVSEMLYIRINEYTGSFRRSGSDISA